MTKDLFIESVASLVVKYGKDYNLKATSAIIAQACLESGFGSSGLSARYNNHFGLKCGSKWSGKSVNLSTREEYTAGTMTTIRDNFRVYDSFADGVKGYFEFMQYSRYHNLRGITDSETYLNTLIVDGYATDKQYVSKCMKIISAYDLKRFDTLSFQPKTYEEYAACAVDCIRGKYGNGLERSAAVTRAGFRYDKVQKIVNVLLG